MTTSRSGVTVLTHITPQDMLAIFQQNLDPQHSPQKVTKCVSLCFAPVFKGTMDELALYRLQPGKLHVLRKYHTLWFNGMSLVADQLNVTGLNLDQYKLLMVQTQRPLAEATWPNDIARLLAIIAAAATHPQQ